MYSRCAISSFTKNAHCLLDVLSSESRKELKEAGLLSLFHSHSIPQNIPLLHFLLLSYSTQKKAFLLGKYYVKFTINHVALILGLHNKGVDFHFKRLPLANILIKDLVKEIEELATEEWSANLDSRRMDALVKYVLAVLFFPLKGLKISESVNSVQGLKEFKKYNWPKAIHSFLHSQFDKFSKVAATKDDSHLGYIEGCSVLLAVSTSLINSRLIFAFLHYVSILFHATDLVLRTYHDSNSI